VREWQDPAPAQTPAFEVAGCKGELAGRSGFFASILLDINRTRWHHRRDGMLVDHLGNGILEQNNVLVKRFNLALQFDAIDQIDRNRHMLAAQHIKKRVL
jgi:hypothetical protein